MAEAIITSVHPDELAYELDLAKRFTDQVGFLSQSAVEHYAALGSVWRAKENGEPAGFLVATISISSTPRLAQIYQAAVQMDAQRRAHGLALVTHACREARERGAGAIQCWCAADLEANAFWRAAGFDQVNLRLGGRRRQRRHFLWRRALIEGFQLKPRKAKPQDAPGSTQVPLFDLEHVP